jgi:hypothetical protein
MAEAGNPAKSLEEVSYNLWHQEKMKNQDMNMQDLNKNIEQIQNL